MSAVWLVFYIQDEDLLKDLFSCPVEALMSLIDEAFGFIRQLNHGNIAAHLT